MEKLQVAIEQARKRREGNSSRSQQGSAAAQTSETNTKRTRLKPRLLPNNLAERWEALEALHIGQAPTGARRLLAHTPGPQASHFDVLRTKLLIELRKNGWRRVAITSPTSSCGKTTTAANLAVSISRQGDLRTALFDFDLRRPGIARVFAHEPKHDISEFLEGQIEFAEQAVQVNGNLAISMAKRPQADPTRLLASETMGDLIDQVEKDFAPDVMLFDLPPLLASDDARSFLRNVNCALLMARAEVTTAQQIDICEREIAEQTNVLGVVLNECRFSEGRQTETDYSYG